MSHVQLPLFPLGVVLFPGSALPLHIFEERYRLLVGQSSRTGAEFGINFTRKGNLSRIGCTARVREVVRRYEDGSFDVIVEGVRRFSVVEFHRDQAPYVIGRVEFIEQAQEHEDTGLITETLELYNRLVGIVYRDEDFQLTREGGASPLSFRMAQKAGLDLASRQHLLEVDSENERLEWLRSHLTLFLPKLENAAEIDRIARNDGYVS